MSDAFCRIFAEQMLHVQQHLVGLGAQLGLVAVDRSPVLSQVAQPTPVTKAWKAGEYFDRN